MSVVRALNRVSEAQGLQGLGKQGASLVEALEDALKQGRIPRDPRRADDGAPVDSKATRRQASEEVRVATTLLGALRRCRISDEKEVSLDCSAWRQP